METISEVGLQQLQDATSWIPAFAGITLGCSEGLLQLSPDHEDALANKRLRLHHVPARAKLRLREVVLTGERPCPPMPNSP